ncbi:hypothetical protein [Arthrobacter sp. A2-55]|uniref:hypothetical protein n=1 Tax=Arthrobacter sp. A2-55 TaxID=2897337 RepID=UPI0021CD290C|nr:hypothetical protein [Arthrobacter sp. A2-55]MCU6481319.1 hypothetical protein [Arthrobacter sp. A2-55]
MKASSNRTRPKIARARVSSSDGEVEVAYFTKRGRSELNLTGVGTRFYIQEVRASRDGSYWDTVEVAGNEEYAVRRAESLALTEGRSIRVARKVSTR